jgi:CheY-like chemotaxis protein
MTNRSRILIADDHTLVAELCKRLLETEYDVVGIVSYGHTLVHRWTRDSLTPVTETDGRTEIPAAPARPRATRAFSAQSQM